MKKLIYTLLLSVGSLASLAQESAKVKDFGGFILDMGTMLNAESLVVSPVMFPTLSYLAPFTGQVPFQLNPDAFKLNPHVTYGTGAGLSPSALSVPSLLYRSAGSGMLNWQGTSYKLNNGMRINLYGEYNADGYRVYNPSALPWERNNFNAAFEMKSANGNFGIKVEVHGGRNNP